MSEQQEQKQRRQSVGRAAFFKSKPDHAHAFHGMIEVKEAIPAGAVLDVSLYKEVSAKGNAYLSGACYIKPMMATPRDASDLDVDF